MICVFVLFYLQFSLGHSYNVTITKLGVAYKSLYIFLTKSSWCNYPPIYTPCHVDYVALLPIMISSGYLILFFQASPVTPISPYSPILPLLSRRSIYRTKVCQSGPSQSWGPAQGRHTSLLPPLLAKQGPQSVLEKNCMLIKCC